MIVVVGSNPSNKSPDKTAFSTHTRSGRTIREWFSGVPDVCFVNVSDEPTPGNRPLLVSEIHANLTPLKAKLDKADKIVVVGNTATYAIAVLRLSPGWNKPYLHIPHPSERNRLLNSKTFKEEQGKKLRDFLQISNHGSNSSDPL